MGFASLFLFLILVALGGIVWFLRSLCDLVAMAIALNLGDDAMKRVALTEGRGLLAKRLTSMVDRTT